MINLKQIKIIKILKIIDYKVKFRLLFKQMNNKYKIKIKKANQNKLYKSSQ